MVKVTLFRSLSFALLSYGTSLAKSNDIMLPRQYSDPCAAIAGQSYVVPSKLLACLNSFAFNATLRDNIVEVVSKTLNFHTSVNYQLSAPPPFTDIHVDIVAELDRIKQSRYDTDFAFHKDIASQVRLLFDGHCTYINYCYDSLFVTYLPFPLVNINSGPGLSQQDVHIAPQAFDVISIEFDDFVDQWQAIAGYNFTKYSGAKVLAIDGQDPWVSVESSAMTIGAWQGRSSRENSFFSSYTRSIAGADWSFRMGDFASRSLPPTKDSVNMTVIPINATAPETIIVPFISRNTTAPFTDAQDLWKNNCVPVDDTNGVDYFINSTESSGFRSGGSDSSDDSNLPVLVDPSPRKFSEPILPEDRRRPISSFIDLTAFVDIALPPTWDPPTAASGNGTAWFYIQGKVGVFTLGSFSTGANFTKWFDILTEGFGEMKNAGVTHLIVDVSNNGGGFICVAAFLHRFLAGPKSTTEPQAGFDTEARYNSLASNITQYAADGNVKRRGFLLYDPQGWKFPNASLLPDDYNWLEPPVKKVVNGREDAFSQKLGEECKPYPVDLPDEPYLPIENIGIVNNGRCASSCAIFTITMTKKEGAKIAVVGGRNSTEQQFTGTVGGQSTDFATIQSEVKSTHFESDPLAPPDFITNSFQGLTWRLGFAVTGNGEPEEWQNHVAENFPLTLDTVNNPSAIWASLAAHWWPGVDLS